MRRLKEVVRKKEDNEKKYQGTGELGVEKSCWGSA